MDSRCGVATAALEIPAVTDFPPDTDVFSIIETGDWVKLDGTTGDVIITKKDLGCFCLPNNDYRAGEASPAPFLGGFYGKSIQQHLQRCLRAGNERSIQLSFCGLRTDRLYDAVLVWQRYYTSRCSV